MTDDDSDEGQAALARDARRLVRQARTAALATVDGSGAPQASLVLSACSLSAEPIFLLSDLALHSRNINHDPRVAVLFDDARELEDPLTGGRLNLSGIIEPVDDELIASRYLRRHPSAAGYVEFTDFGFYRVRPGSGHFVAGFGRIETLNGKGLVHPPPPEFASRESDIIDHMNADHDDAARLMARHHGGGGGEWRFVGCDHEGIDLARGGVHLRVDFPSALRAADEARGVLAELVTAAREAAGKSAG